MASPSLNLRNLLALLLLLALVVLCVSLGRWQMDRAAAREGIAHAIAAERDGPPVRLTAAISTDELREWRPAIAEGHWLDEYSVLLDNRNQDGRPGMWLATPLRLDDGSDQAVLVLRGWLVRPMGQEKPGLPEASTARQEVSGQLRAHVPQLYEIWQRSGQDSSALPLEWGAAQPPLVQNLDLARLERATGLKLLPIVLEQTGGAPPGDTLKREWPTPSLDADKNRGYALQWFGFAVIAGVAALLLLWRCLRPRRAARPS